MIPYFERRGSIGYMNVFPDVKQAGFDFDKYNQRFHDANIIIDGRTKSMAYDPHWGPLSIKAARGGSEFYKSGDALYRVDDSCILIFNEGKYYESWIDEAREIDTFTFNMTPSFERNALAAIQLNRRGDVDDNGKVEKIRFTERTYTKTPRVALLMNEIRSLGRELSSSHARIQELFFSLYVEMVSLQAGSVREALATGKMKASSRKELHQRLIIAKEFLRASIKDDITLNDLSCVACLNPYYLLREFRKVFRCTPHQYLTHQRMDSAQRLLISDSSEVWEVSLAVGYRDPSSFSKLFRRYAGCSPTDFRRRGIQGKATMNTKDHDGHNAVEVSAPVVLVV
jgi:AraC family transcriptional regulator